MPGASLIPWDTFLCVRFIAQRAHESVARKTGGEYLVECKDNERGDKPECSFEQEKDHSIPSNFFIQVSSCKGFWNIPVFNVRMVVFPSPVKR